MHQLSVQIAEDISGGNVSIVSANSRIYYRGKCINRSKCMFEQQNILQGKMDQLSMQTAEDISGGNVSIVSANSRI